MFTFASGGHLLDQAGDPTFPDKDKVPLAVLEWWVAAANDWKIFNAQANMEVLASGTLTPMRTQRTQPGYGGVAFVAAAIAVLVRGTPEGTSDRARL